MTSWLDPLRAALDAAGRRVDVFVRDDDAGWDDDRLERLCDRFDAAGAPLDVAVIPAELHRALADRLRARVAAGSLAVHPHGWAHLNHEDAGRKHEFGPSRAEQDQRADLERARAVLLDAFGEDAGACFVPPWNRCTPVTARLLVEAGFSVLSRDVTATPVDVPGLQELPVTVDWFARRRGVPVDRHGRGRLLAEAAGRGRIGLMLHHAVLSESDLADLDELLAVLTRHPAVELQLMCRLFRPAAPPAPPSGPAARASTSAPAR